MRLPKDTTVTNKTWRTGGSVSPVGGLQPVNPTGFRFSLSLQERQSEVTPCRTPFRTPKGRNGEAWGGAEPKKEPEEGYEEPGQSANFLILAKACRIMCQTNPHTP